MAVVAALGPLGVVALGTLVLALLLRWLWDGLVAVTRLRATCHQLNKFPVPPWRNWLLGHTGMGQSTEQGLQQVDALVARYRHGCLWWGLPWLPVLRLFHPSTLRPLLSASGGTPHVSPGPPMAVTKCHPPWPGQVPARGGHRAVLAVPKGVTVASLWLSPSPGPLVAVGAGEGPQPAVDGCGVPTQGTRCHPGESPPSCHCPLQLSWPPRTKLSTASSSPGLVSGEGDSGDSTPGWPQVGLGVSQGWGQHPWVSPGGSGCVTGVGTAPLGVPRWIWRCHRGGDSTPGCPQVDLEMSQGWGQHLWVSPGGSGCVTGVGTAPLGVPRWIRVCHRVGDSTPGCPRVDLGVSQGWGQHPWVAPGGSGCVTGEGTAPLGVPRWVWVCHRGGDSTPGCPQVDLGVSQGWGQHHWVAPGGSGCVTGVGDSTPGWPQVGPGVSQGRGQHPWVSPGG
uniref:Leukotriene-B(4) omega-hydroxylase 2-like n=1 Tax=Cyanistes caeruleus TaxID=156563 RepID=A0A8C0UBR5_CYACU